MTDTPTQDAQAPAQEPQDLKQAPAQSEAAEQPTLEEQLAAAKLAHARALADYQNLVRRTQQEKARWAQLATQGFVEQLLQPLEHLSMASDQLGDAGLLMVIKQLWATLESNGLKEIEVLGKPFDVETMEVVETQTSEGADEGANPSPGSKEALKEQDEKKLKVVKVHRRGYKLGDVVIQHAKVVLG